MPAEKTDVVIVGGGNVGSTTAYFLSKEGKRVTVVERDGVGNHASGFAYGALSPLGGVGIPGPVLPLAIEAMRLYTRLAATLQEETEIDIQFQLKSTLALAFMEEEAQRLQGNFSWQQGQQGYEVEWLDGSAVRDIDPRISPKALGGVYTRGTAEVDPYRLVLALTHAAERHGVVFRHGEVVGLKRKGDKVIGVTLADGEVLCGEVVLAQGPWTGGASQWLGMDVPIGPLKGQILRLRVPGSPLQCTIGWAGNYATTKPDGLVWAGTTEEVVGFDETPTAEARDHIMSALLTMAPPMEAAQLVHHTACLRPVAPDGLLILGKVPEWEGVYIATGGGRKGILLGPIMARITADLIMGLRNELPIEPFVLGRFSSSSP